MFLAPGGTYAGIPPEFAYPAAFDDPVAAILATAAIPAVATGHRSARIMVWVFNLEGPVDLAAGMFLATYFGASRYMGPAYWIPAFRVPALLLTHHVTFVLLCRCWRREPRQEAARTTAAGSSPAVGAAKRWIHEPDTAED